MNKRIRNTLAALGVIVALYTSVSDRSSIESNSSEPSLNSSSNANSTTLGATRLPERAEMLTAPNAVTQTVPVVQADIPRTAWQVIQGAPQRFAVASAVKEKVTVDLSGVELGNATPGERMSFALPDGSTVAARVENTWTEANGDKVWSGHVEEGASNDYRILVTQGASVTFASINTSKGNYSLESINGRGVVYKNPEMGDVAPQGTTDYLVPGK